MNRIERSGRRILGSCLLAAATSASSLQAGEPAVGTAKISGPAAVSPVASSVADPFTGTQPIPTPIVTYSGRLSEPTPAAPSGLTSLAPPSTAPLTPSFTPPVTNIPPPTHVIGAGPLVPVNLANPPPQNSTTSASSIDPAKSGLSPLTPDRRDESKHNMSVATESAALTPIKPAAISRDSLSSPENVTSSENPKPQSSAKEKAKTVAVKKSPAKSKPVEKPTEQVAPAVNFSFPQPVIPLESMLRRWFKWPTLRG